MFELKESDYNPWDSFVYEPKNIQLCELCLRKFIPTVSPVICGLCLKSDNKLPIKRTLWETNSWWSDTYKATRSWRQRNKDKVNEYKRSHKKRHPESVKAWNDRYREKNRATLRERDNAYYKFKKQCLMKAVNDRVIVKRIEENKVNQSASGIILPDSQERNIVWAEVKFVSENPSIPLKKGDIIGYEYGFKFKDDKTDWEVVNIKEILVIK